VIRIFKTLPPEFYSGGFFFAFCIKISIMKIVLKRSTL
jgi:hypothetical protein